MKSSDEQVLQASPLVVARVETWRVQHRAEAPPTHHIPHSAPLSTAEVHLSKVFPQSDELPVELHSAGLLHMSTCTYVY